MGRTFSSILAVVVLVVAVSSCGSAAGEKGDGGGTGTGGGGTIGAGGSAAGDGGATAGDGGATAGDGRGSDAAAGGAADAAAGAGGAAGTGGSGGTSSDGGNQVEAGDVAAETSVESACGDTGSIVGACEFYDGTSLQICQQYVGTIMKSIVQTACAGLGTFTTNPCPTANRVGGICVQSCGIPSVRLVSKYAGTPDSVASDCTNFGGTYVANP